MQTYPLYNKQIRLIRKIYKDDYFCRTRLSPEGARLVRLFAKLSLKDEAGDDEVSVYEYDESQRQRLNAIRDRWVMYSRLPDNNKPSSV